ncbi:MAG TPA: methyl-accepting chemotaxis protein, partial [Alcanivorax sp.]|nr:methyl-accepting chemotaxis protein [Alcanivorax sp.]
MLSQFKIGARLGGAFAVILLLLLAASGTGLFSVTRIADTTREALETDGALASNAGVVRRLALELRRYEKDVFINLADFQALNGYFGKWSDTVTRLKSVLDEGEALAVAPALQQRYRDAREGLGAYESDFTRIYGAIMDGTYQDTAAANAAFSENKQGIYQLEDAAQGIHDIAMENLGGLGATLQALVTQALLGLVVFAAVALLVSAVLAVVITRSITLPLADALGVARRIAQGDLRERIVARGRDEPAQLLAAMAEMSDSLVKLVSALRGASETVYIGANEIALGAQDLSSRTEEQAAALQETAASMEEISATSEHNEKNTREADRLADAASRSAQHGGEEMRANIDLMEKVVASSKKMNGIIATIDD